MGGTHGFAAENDPSVAVCLLPGTEVAFEKEIQIDQPWSFFRPRATGTVARFRQVNMDKQNMHHDALELADGRIFLVHALHVGQHATVLQLPSSQQPAGDASSQAVTTIVDVETPAPAQPIVHATADGLFP